MSFIKFIKFKYGESLFKYFQKYKTKRRIIMDKKSKVSDKSKSSSKSDSSSSDESSTDSSSSYSGSTEFAEVKSGKKFKKIICKWPVILLLSLLVISGASVPPIVLLALKGSC